MSPRPCRSMPTTSVSGSSAGTSSRNVRTALSISVLASSDMGADCSVGVSQRPVRAPNRSMHGSRGAAATRICCPPATARRSRSSTAATPTGCSATSCGARTTPSWRRTSRPRPSRPPWPAAGAFAPDAGHASAWLFGIASKKLIDAQRRGYAERRAHRRLGMERIELDRRRHRAHREPRGRSRPATLIDVLVPDQRFAVQAHVVEEREYARDRPGPERLRGGGAQARQPRPRRPAPPDGSRP